MQLTREWAKQNWLWAIAAFVVLAAFVGVSSVAAQPSGSEPGPRSRGLDSERAIRSSRRWLGLAAWSRPAITFIIVRIDAGTHQSTVACETKSPHR